MKRPIRKEKKRNQLLSLKTSRVNKMETIITDTTTTGNFESIGYMQVMAQKTYGWICPICGSGISPYADVCPFCHGNGYRWPWPHIEPAIQPFWVCGDEIPDTISRLNSHDVCCKDETSKPFSESLKEFYPYPNGEA
jgi:hypothetical protein